MTHKKGDLYRFKATLRANSNVPSNYFSLISHFVDEEDKIEKLILRDSGTSEALVANADDMELVPNATFEEKLLSCLTDIGESLRILSQGASFDIEVEEEEPPLEKKTSNKKKNVH